MQLGLRNPSSAQWDSDPAVVALGRQGPSTSLSFWLCVHDLSKWTSLGPRWDLRCTGANVPRGTGKGEAPYSCDAVQHRARAQVARSAPSND